LTILLQIVEFGSPSELSEKSGGIFASMMKSLAGNNGEKDART
jgi:ABC-type multidrug transport system fused ATPase/permease subunit